MVGITIIMESVKYNKYEDALKHVKKIKSFHRHVVVYFIFNIVIVALWWKLAQFVLNTTPNPEKGFIDWMYINVWSTPVLWGIGLLIHGLYVYRFKFSFFRTWEERKIREFMDEGDQEKGLTKDQKWWE
jgi:hypothetical protein